MNKITLKHAFLHRKTVNTQCQQNLRTPSALTIIAITLSACQAESAAPTPEPIVWPDIKSAGFRCGRLPVAHIRKDIVDAQLLNRRVTAATREKYGLEFLSGFTIEGECASFVVNGGTSAVRLANKQFATIRPDGWMVAPKRTPNDGCLPMPDRKLVQAVIPGQLVDVFQMKQSGTDAVNAERTFIAASNKEGLTTVSQFLMRNGRFIGAPEAMFTVEGTARGIHFFSQIHGFGGTITLTLDNGNDSVLVASFGWRPLKSNPTPTANASSSSIPVRR